MEVGDFKSVVKSVEGRDEIRLLMPYGEGWEGFLASRADFGWVKWRAATTNEGQQGSPAGERGKRRDQNLAHICNKEFIRLDEI